MLCDSDASHACVHAIQPTAVLMVIAGLVIYGRDWTHEVSHVLQALSKKEIEWVNNYHQEVWTKVSPHLQQDADLLAWVKKNTQPL